MSYSATAGAGLTFAADQVGTPSAPTSNQLVPFVAIGTGTLGSLQLATAANPLPVRSGLQQVAIVTPTITASAAYASGNCIGGLQTLTNMVAAAAGVAKLDTITIIDKANQKAPLTLIFFELNPTAATITDKTNFVFSTNNVNVCGKVDILATDYETINSQAVVSKTVLGLIMQAVGVSNQNIYVAVVTTGTPTYLTTADMIFKYGYIQN